MLNKNDPLIGAVQQVMQQSNAEREATRIVNERFGIESRKSLPHEYQAQWNAEYQQVLSESADLAALAPPHHKVTKKDVLVGRGVLEKHPTKPGKHILAKEEEQIDELSRGTLERYVNKAGDQAGRAAVKGALGDKEAQKTFKKRLKGASLIAQKERRGAIKEEETYKEMLNKAAKDTSMMPAAASKVNLSGGGSAKVVPGNTPKNTTSSVVNAAGGPPRGSKFGELPGTNRQLTAQAKARQGFGAPAGGNYQSAQTKAAPALDPTQKTVAQSQAPMRQAQNRLDLQKSVQAGRVGDPGKQNFIQNARAQAQREKAAGVDGTKRLPGPENQKAERQAALSASAAERKAMQGRPQTLSPGATNAAPPAPATPRAKPEPIKVSDTEVMNSPEYKNALKSVGGNRAAKNIQVGQRVAGLGRFNAGDTITSRTRTQLAAKKNVGRELEENRRISFVKNLAEMIKDLRKKKTNGT